jgi:hypothetical protein
VRTKRIRRLLRFQCHVMSEPGSADGLDGYGTQDLMTSLARPGRGQARAGRGMGGCLRAFRAGAGLHSETPRNPAVAGFKARSPGHGEGCAADIGWVDGKSMLEEWDPSWLPR